MLLQIQVTKAPSKKKTLQKREDRRNQAKQARSNKRQVCFPKLSTWPIIPSCWVLLVPASSLASFHPPVNNLIIHHHVVASQAAMQSKRKGSVADAPLAVVLVPLSASIADCLMLRRLMAGDHVAESDVAALDTLAPLTYVDGKHKVLLHKENKK